MMMLYQAGPAQTLNYMIAGFVVIFGILGLYVISMIVRARNSKRDIEMLQELSQKGR